MIAYLKGQILKKTDKEIIIDTGNIGYLVKSSKNLLSEIGDEEEIELFIHSHIREDAFDLYGFRSYKELTFFKILISINGIGPKVALEILTFPQEKIKAAIANEDSAFICQVPGIGAKTAKRIILELKDKIELEPDRLYKKIEQNMNDEVIDALTKLGYQKQEISKILQNLPKEIEKTEEVITYFLKHN